MNENPNVPADRRNIWIRGLLMLLMAMILHVAGTVLFIIALVQFVITLASDTPNACLVSFGSGLARYFRQIVNFMTFATEEIPFPFSDWPTGN